MGVNRQPTPCREGDHGRFEVVTRDGWARNGRLHTSTHVLSTPALLPVINPNIRTVEPAEMWEKYGFEAVITNSYVIWKHEDLTKQAREEGVHAMLNFPGVIMTDSGTFQNYIYGDVEVGVAEIVAFQREIGVDIATMLDVFGTPDMTREEIDEAVMETAARSEDSLKAAEGILMNGPIQGGVHADLRQRSAELMGEHGFAVHPIGGIVPLMERQRYRELIEIIVACREHIPAERPVHIFGCGHPHLFPICVALGADLFDSAAYAIFARDDRILFPWGTVRLSALAHWPYASNAFSGITPDEVRALPDDERCELLSRHNLEVTAAEISRCRQAVRDGTIWQLVEERSHTNPALREATLWLYDNLPNDLINSTESLRDGGVIWSEDLPLHPPSLAAYDRLLSKVKVGLNGSNVIVLYGKQAPWRDRCGSLVNTIDQRWPNAVILVHTPLGLIPYSLEDLSPFAHVVGPDALWVDVDPEAVTSEVEDLLSGQAGSILCFDMSEEDLEILSGIESALGEGESTDEDSAHRLQVSSIRDKVTFFTDLSRDDAEDWLSGCSFVYSRTGRVRNVMDSDDNHILSPRMRDGGLSLTLAGASHLHSNGALPAFVVNSDAAEYARKGRNVMFGFILGIQGEPTPGLPCRIIDESGELIAHGISRCTADEAMRFRKGVAVKIRDGVGNGSEVEPTGD